MYNERAPPNSLQSSITNFPLRTYQINAQAFYDLHFQRCNRRHWTTIGKLRSENQKKTKKSTTSENHQHNHGQRPAPAKHPKQKPPNHAHQTSSKKPPTAKKKPAANGAPATQQRPVAPSCVPWKSTTKALRNSPQTSTSPTTKPASSWNCRRARRLSRPRAWISRRC